jgi:cytidylate kinase
MKTIAEIRRDLRLMSKKLRQNRIDPVLTIDGLGASGKGMVASKLAADLKWNLLDTGLYYRCCAFGFAENGFRNVPELVHHFEMEGFPFEMCRQAPWLSMGL